MGKASAIQRNKFCYFYLMFLFNALIIYPLQSDAAPEDCYLSQSKIVYSQIMWPVLDYQVGLSNLFTDIDGDLFREDTPGSGSYYQHIMHFGYGSNGKRGIQKRGIIDETPLDYYKRVVDAALSVGAKTIIVSCYGGGGTRDHGGWWHVENRNLVDNWPWANGCEGNIMPDDELLGGLEALQAGIQYAHNHGVAVVVFGWANLLYDYVIDVNKDFNYFERNENFNPLETWLYKPDINPEADIKSIVPTNAGEYFRVWAREGCPDNCHDAEYWVKKEKILDALSASVNYSSIVYQDLERNLFQYLFSPHDEKGLDLDGIVQDSFFYNPHREGATSEEAFNNASLLGKSIIVARNDAGETIRFDTVDITKGKHHTGYAKIMAIQMEEMRTHYGKNSFTKGDEKIYLLEGYYQTDDYKYFINHWNEFMSGAPYPFQNYYPMPNGILDTIFTKSELKKNIQGRGWYYPITAPTWGRLKQLLAHADHNHYKNILYLYGSHHSNHLGSIDLQDAGFGGHWKWTWNKDENRPFNIADVRKWLADQDWDKQQKKCDHPCDWIPEDQTNPTCDGRWVDCANTTTFIDIPKRAPMASLKVIAMHYIRQQAMANGYDVETLTVPGHNTPYLHPLSEEVLNKFVNQQGTSITGQVWPGYPPGHRCGIPANGLISDWPLPYWGYASCNQFVYQNCPNDSFPETFFGYQDFGGDWTLAKPETRADFDIVCNAYLAFLDQNPDLSIPASAYWKNVDFDDDGVGDIADNCPYHANLVQEDTDNDGSGNVCDNCPNNKNSMQEDGDGDGAGDVCDNCGYRPNGSALGTCIQMTGKMRIGVGSTCTLQGDCLSDQICDMVQGDLDSNGIGDACECYADFDDNAKVDLADVLQMKREFPSFSCATDNCQTDANNDGKVDISDFVILRAQFLSRNCPLSP
jgi:hypothetical protein